MTVNTPFSGLVYHACTSIYQHTTFEVPSLTDSKDMIVAKLKTGHVTLTTAIRR